MPKIYNPKTKRWIQNTKRNRERIKKTKLNIIKKSLNAKLKIQFLNKKLLIANLKEEKMRKQLLKMSLRNSRRFKDNARKKKKKTRQLKRKVQMDLLILKKKPVRVVRRNVVVRGVLIKKPKIFYISVKCWFLAITTRKNRNGQRIFYRGEYYELRYEKITFKSKKNSKKLKRITIHQFNEIIGYNCEDFFQAFVSGTWILDIIEVQKHNKHLDLSNVEGLNVRLLGAVNKRAISSINTIMLKNSGATSLNNILMDEYQYEKKSGSCWIDTIMLNYKISFQKRRKKPLTVEEIFETIGKKYRLIRAVKTQHYEYSIKEIIPFFKKYSLYMECYNIKGMLIYYYEPKKKDGSVKKQKNHQITRVMIHNNHVYRITTNLNSLKQKVRFKKVALEKSKHGEVMYYEISPYFKMPKVNVEEDEATTDIDIKEENYDIQIIKDYETLMNAIIKTNNDTHILYIGMLSNIVVDLYKVGICVQIVSVKNMRVMKFSLKFINEEGKKYNILVDSSLYDIPGELSDVEKITVPEWQRYKELKGDLYESVVKNRNKSLYSEDLYEHFNTYSRYALLQTFENTFKEGEKVYEIDDVKAYSDTLMRIDSYGKFNEFDHFLKYKNEEIKAVNFYIAQRPKKCENLDLLIFDKKYIMMSGAAIIKLSEEHGYFINILRVIQPFKTCDNTTTAEHVEYIYESKDVPMILKKHACNSVIGSVGKKKNAKSSSIISDNLNDVSDYIDLDASDENKKRQSQYMIFHEDDALTLYLSEKTNTNDLKDGFRVLQFMIYDLQRVKLFASLKLAHKYNFKIQGCRTDAIYVSANSKDSDFKGLLAEHNTEIGRKKVILKKVFIKNTFGKVLKVNGEYTENTLIPMYKYKQEVINIEDEYNNDEMIRKIQANNCLSITAMYPGCGKSYILGQLKNTLFVCPYNRLCYESRKSNGHDAITMDKFLGLGRKKDKKKNYKKSYDITGYDNIVFDEINCHPVYKLQKLYTYIKEVMLKNSILKNELCVEVEGEDIEMEIDTSEEIKTVNFYCAGDEFQIEAINGDCSEYINQAIKQIFQKTICLKEIKRQSNEEDIRTIKFMKHLLFETDTELNEILSLLTNESIYNINSGVNVCYYNTTCDKVNNKFIKYNNGKFSMHNENDIIFKGDTGIYDEIKLYSNYLYKVIDTTNAEYIEIYDYANNEQYSVKRRTVESLFKPAHSFTCHSIQGLSFDDEYINIFDAYDNKRISRRWLWVAITRARKLSNIRICNTNMWAYNNFKNSEHNEKDINKALLNQFYACSDCMKVLDLNKMNIYENGDELTLKCENCN